MGLTGVTGILIAQLAVTQAADNTATLVSKVNVVDFSKPNGAWSGAEVGQSLATHDRLRTGEDSRAAAKLGDATMLRIDELTTIEILPPKDASGKATLDVKQGSTYFFSREKSREINFQTPAANGAIRGTEFLLTVTPQHRTLVAMLSGEVELSDSAGRMVLGKGDQGEAEPGQSETKGDIRNAMNSVQWYLLIETKLPPHETVVTADKQQFLDGLCDAMKQWRMVAPQVVKAAVQKRRELGPDILRTALRCLGGDCGAVAQVVAAVVAADPTRAAEYTELAIQISPGCANEIEHGAQTNEGNFTNPPANINAPPGSIGGGAIGNVCIVCHNGSEVQVACSDLQSYLQSHPGDTSGPCQPTPVTNP